MSEPFSTPKMSNLMRAFKVDILVSMVCLLMPLGVRAQVYHGTTGLLQVPSAETDSAGTFRGGLFYLDRRFTPSKYGDYNTFGYTIGITAFPWLEVSYSATMLKYVIEGLSSEPRYYNEDRHVNVKLRPLKEGRWWPAIAVGMDDIGRFASIKDGLNGNNFFQNIYIVGSKHFELGGNQLGVHLAYRYYTTSGNTDRRGLAGGLTFRPVFFRPLRVVAEWDGVGVNVGADVLLWQRLFIQASLVHGRGFMGGLSYRYTIPH